MDLTTLAIVKKLQNKNNNSSNENNSNNSSNNENNTTSNDTLIVHIKGNFPGENEYNFTNLTIDKTYTEISNAVRSGQNVQCEFRSILSEYVGDETYICTLDSISDPYEDDADWYLGGVIFQSHLISSVNGYYFMSFTINSEGNLLGYKNYIDSK